MFVIYLSSAGYLICIALMKSCNLLRGINVTILLSQSRIKTSWEILHYLQFHISREWLCWEWSPSLFNHPPLPIPPPSQTNTFSIRVLSLKLSDLWDSKHMTCGFLGCEVLERPGLWTCQWFQEKLERSVKQSRGNKKEHLFSLLCCLTLFQLCSS